MLEPIELIIVLMSIAEVGLLTLLERRLWGTIYTPLCFLMLPYALVSTISIIMVEVFRLYPFNYYALLYWDLALLVFFIPSTIVQLSVQRANHTIAAKTRPRITNTKLVLFLLFLLIGIYALHLRSVAASGIAAIGSDEYAENASTNGIWGHLFTFIIAVQLVCGAYFSRKQWWLGLFLFIFLIFAVLNQVKGYVIIPLIAICIVHLFNGTLKLNIRIILTTVAGGFGFFFLSYYLNLAFSEDKEVSDALITFIFRNFGHYLSSGILGLSMDITKGIVEPQNPEYLFTPFVNIWNTITGQPMLSSLNPNYFQTSWEGLANNIRSFAGSIYIYGGWVFGTFTILLFSFIAYFLHYKRIASQNPYWAIAGAWMSALLAMGWFDYYFALLRPYEVFILLYIILYTKDFFTKPRLNHDAVKESQDYSC